MGKVRDASKHPIQRGLERKEKCRRGYFVRSRDKVVENYAQHVREQEQIVVMCPVMKGVGSGELSHLTDDLVRGQDRPSDQHQRDGAKVEISKMDKKAT